MGKIYDSKIKSIAKTLLANYDKYFTVDYRTNKEALKKITRFKSKKLLNRVAGYITSLKASAARRMEEEELEIGEK
ncbi:MAG: 30S ribosomal protein S17e [Thermoproteota archaeon]